MLRGEMNDDDAQGNNACPEEEEEEEEEEKEDEKEEEATPGDDEREHSARSVPSLPGDEGLQRGYGESGFRGVYRHGRGWTATTAGSTHPENHKRLGTFASSIEAARGRRDWLKHHGETDLVYDALAAIKSLAKSKPGAWSAREELLFDEVLAQAHSKVKCHDHGLWQGVREVWLRPA